MFGLVSGGLLNILGDYLLINKFGLGVYGAGLSTAISQLISFTILLIVYIKMAQSKISLKYISVDAKEYERVRKSLLFTLGFGFIFVTTLAITGFVLAEPIANFLQEDP